VKLVFDTSALRNITARCTSPALEGALLSRLGDPLPPEVWVPATVVLELENQANLALSGGLLRGAQAGADHLAWVIRFWQAAATTPNQGGGYLSFDEAQARAIVQALGRRGHGWFLSQKARKVLADARPFVNKAVDALYTTARWRVSGPCGSMAFKGDLHAEAEKVAEELHTEAERAAGQPYEALTRINPSPSATIDWLHQGAALHKDAKLVTDDTGIDANAFGKSITSEALFAQLNLVWT
jgi:hypothetical protein